MAARPVARWRRRSERGGIVVDERMATSVPHVWAAGDVAEIPHGLTRTPLQGLTGSHAYAQGKTAGSDRPVAPPVQPVRQLQQRAAEAAAAGLVSRIAPAGKVLETARGVAEEILAASPTSVRASIATMEQSDAITDTVDAVHASTSVLDSLVISGDTLEGIMAFVMKRTPNWKGH